MSVLIATPAYAGLVTAQHMKSCLALGAAFDAAGFKHDWHLGWNESLIQRARNSMAAMFLLTDYQKLLFIDADIEFEPEGVAALWNLNADVCAGLYCMKRPDKPLSAWRNGKLVKIEECPKEPFEVDYAGTGFMMVDRTVLEKFKAKWPERTHQEGTGESFNWFDTRVIEDGTGNWFASEDYCFCLDFRSLGGKIIADPNIKLIHHGSFGYG